MRIFERLQYLGTVAMLVAWRAHHWYAPVDAHGEVRFEPG